MGVRRPLLNVLDGELAKAQFLKYGNQLLNAAKHEGMTKARSRSNTGERPEVFVSSPGYPKTASEVIRCLKKALEKAERLPGQELTQKETPTLIGAPKSTLHDWFHGNLAAPIKHVGVTTHGIIL